MDKHEAIGILFFFVVFVCAVFVVTYLGMNVLSQIPEQNFTEILTLPTPLPDPPTPIRLNATSSDNLSPRLTESGYTMMQRGIIYINHTIPENATIVDSYGFTVRPGGSGGIGSTYYMVAGGGGAVNVSYGGGGMSGGYVNTTYVAHYV
jgi:hypothetical protein